MEDYGLVWVDITPDFDPHLYAESFADEDQADLIRESESVEDSLRALYEWGYLSKRDGRIQFLLPEDQLDEMDYGKALELGRKAKKASRFSRLKGAVKAAGSGAKDAAKKSAGHIKSRISAVHGAGVDSSSFGKGVLSRTATARQYAQGALGNMSRREKMGLGAGAAVGAVGAGLAARAMYKRMKKKKSQKESLNDSDLQDLLDFSEDLGFDFETWEDVNETLELGEYLDGVLEEADNDGITESYSEEDIIEAAMNELGEGERWDNMKSRASSAKDYMKSKASSARSSVTGTKVSRALSGTGGSLKTGFARGRAGGAGRLKSGARAVSGAAKGLWHGYGKTGKGLAIGGAAAGVVGAGLAARALYKRMKKRKQNESLTMDDLVQDSVDFGFEFETYDELIEAIHTGEFIDSYLEDAEFNGLTENFGEADLVLAALEELEEAKGNKLGKDVADAINPFGTTKPVGKALRGAYSGMKAGYKRGSEGGAKRFTGAMRGIKGGAKNLWYGHGKTGKALAIGGAAATGLAARAAYKKMKKNKKKNESIEFNGYRSSSQGSVFESAPVPFGTGNALHEVNAVKRVWDAI